jgi:hypothetical protein
MLILSRMSLDGRTDSSNDNVFESVESEQGIYTPKNIDKNNSFLNRSDCLCIQLETSLPVT